MSNNFSSKSFAALLLLSVLIISSVLAMVTFPASASEQSNQQAGSTSVTSSSDTFAFVSNFETLTLEGWNRLTGSQPTVVTSVDYSGEPALMSVNPLGCECVQADYADKEFVDGLYTVSFQVAIDTSGPGAFFGLGSSGTQFVAVIGVENGNVVGGANLSSLVTIESVPLGTAQPSGWVYVVGNVAINKHGKGMMQVFIDESNASAATISVPQASQYSRALIETVGPGSAFYSDIVVSSTLLAKLFPRWNPMEGYGQGGACLCTTLNVKLLPLFSDLSADMILSSWSVPRANILSFQINANNLTGSTVPKTCVGFFQLGVDLNPNGYIAPWYVKGNDCVAHYFVGSHGVYSPPNSNLSLSILFEPASKQILFTINDSSISRVFSASIPYSDQAFNSMFTQLEFQPSGNISLISEYRLRGEMYNIEITTMRGLTEALPSSYMLPWSVDAPLSWSFTYYENDIAGYSQVSV